VRARGELARAPQSISTVPYVCKPDPPFAETGLALKKLGRLGHGSRSPSVAGRGAARRHRGTAWTNRGNAFSRRSARLSARDPRSEIAAKKLAIRSCV